MRIISFFMTFIFGMLLDSQCIAQQPLSLSDAISQALDNNYDIRVSQLDQKSASVMNSWGAAGGWPSLDFSISGTRSQDLEENSYSDRYAGGLTLNWILFDGFSVRIRKARFSELEKLSQGNTASLVEQTVQSTLLAYYNALLQQEKRHVLDTLRTLSRDRFNKTEAQRKLGALVTYDVLQAKTAWLEDEARYLQQVAISRNAVRDLTYLMGLSEDLSFNLTEAFEVDPNFYQLPVLLDKMQTDNRMLRNKYIQQTLLEKEVALTNSDWAPSLSLRAGMDRTRLEFSENIPTSNSRDAYGTLSLNWNLFSGGARLRAARIARLDREMGEVEIEGMLHNLSNRLAAQLELYNVRKELLNVAKETQETAALNLQISEEKYRTGAINSFNYRDVQLIYLNASVGYLEAIYQVIETDSELLRLTGGIISSYSN